jgi:hypothetical protein
MSRDAKPGELRGIRILEKLEKMFKRPESRLDAQRILGKLSADAQTYARHLVVSGPSGNVAAAKASGLSKEQIELAAAEIETALGIAPPPA